MFDRKWYIYHKLSTPCPGVSVMKRLSLYEFAPKGQDFVSVVRIREGPYYRGFFRGKCMSRVWQIQETVRNRQVSVLERYPYREFRLYYKTTVLISSLPLNCRVDPLPQRQNEKSNQLIQLGSKVSMITFKQNTFTFVILK